MTTAGQYIYSLVTKARERRGNHKLSGLLSLCRDYLGIPFVLTVYTKPLLAAEFVHRNTNDL